MKIRSLNPRVKSKYLSNLYMNRLTPQIIFLPSSEYAIFKVVPREDISSIMITEHHQCGIKTVLKTSIRHLKASESAMLWNQIIKYPLNKKERSQRSRVDLIFSIITSHACD